MPLLRRRAMMMAMQTPKKMEWEQGALGIWGGEELESAKHIRTKGFYPMEAGTYKIATDNNTKSFSYFQYGSDRSKPRKCGGYTVLTTLTYSENGYLRLLMNVSDLSSADHISIEKIS